MRRARPLPLAAALAAVLAVPTSVSLAGGLELKGARVHPAQVYFAGKPLKIRLTVADEQERPLRIEIVSKSTRRITHSWRLPTTASLTRHKVSWNGKSATGKIARDGRYAVRAGVSGRPTRRLGTFRFRRHAYPLDGPHADRGYLGEFGAPRSGGRTHEGFDVNSPCGTPIVAARGGRVLKSKFDPRLRGNFVVIKGRRDRFRYLYAHLSEPSPMRKGDRVLTRELAGHVGQTGNAAGTPCHLHFELRDGGPVDPEPYLDRWQR